MIFPTAREAQDIVSNSSSSLAYIALALGNLATALATPGTYSCTLTVSGKTAQDVQAVRQKLLNLGYRITQSTTTLTILWDNSIAASISY
jgi:hypothetical protein